jgi:Zn-dependent metalloprotease
MSSISKTLSAAILLALAGSAAAANATSEQAKNRALTNLQANPKAAHMANGDQLNAKYAKVDANGAEHVRFTRSFGGLEVIGGDFVVHSRGGQFKSASMTMRDSVKVGTRPSVDQSGAIVSAGADFGSNFTGRPSASLAVYARGATPVLAWNVQMQGTDADGNDRDMTYIVSAKDGKVLDRWSNMETAKPGGGGSTCTSTTPANGTGKSLFSGNVAISTTNCGSSFQMKDQTRGGGYTTNLANGTSGNGTIFSDADNVWGNNTTSDAATVAADAHYGVAMTWDYYKNVHGRNGIANDGKGALSRVHYCRRYVNAFWSDSCFCMSFGDGDGTSYYPLVDIDVAGHEMSHGVTSRSANLTYSGESGGLNEATSDIFGTMVEFYANNTNDTPDYMIGEELYKSNPTGSKALRYMFHPSAADASSDCWYSGVGSLDVHYSSGVANHFFYLLAEGSTDKTFSGVVHHSPVCVAGNTKQATGTGNLAGIGRDAAPRIWYRALTVYMTSSTNSAGARAATISAANDLFGASSTQAAAVAATWSAVGVN